MNNMSENKHDRKTGEIKVFFSVLELVLDIKGNIFELSIVYGFFPFIMFQFCLSV